MKKLIALLCAVVIAFSIVGCGGNGDNGSSDNGGSGNGGSNAIETPAPIPATKDDITEKTDYTTQQWVAVDIPFTATEKSKNIVDTEMDVTFTNRETGTKMVMPAFWNGGTDWIVRFAPTEYGVWDYTTATTGKDIGLSGKSGTLACNSYKGDLEIYQRGFVKTEADKRYFVYNDGTPFFYLGDTHWAMLQEEFDAPGKHAADIKTDSHFKYIVDKRVSQRFTVYQSEPIGSKFDVSDGNVGAGDVTGFQMCDKYFAYIAEKGLVHANAQLIFPSSCTKKFSENIRALTRYWVARYAAYPVLWSLGQEVDNGSNYPDAYNMPDTYVEMCKILSEVDPYKHPTTAHQLNAASVNATGQVAVRGIDGGYNNYDPASTKTIGTTKQSAFYSKPGHTWWGVQWRPTVDQQYNFKIPKNYWFFGENKVAINYESRYDYLYTKNFGARVSGWITYLSGMYGYGYGAADIWCYLSTYSFDEAGNDGVDTITTDDKKMPWGEAVLMPTGDQMTYLRGFLTSAGWWKLVPNFDDGGYFVKDEAQEGCYAAANDGNDTYVTYLYSKTKAGVGHLAKMDGKATYTAQWFDPRTGEYSLISTEIKPTKSGDDYIYQIPEKPQADDMALLVTKN